MAYCVRVHVVIMGCGRVGSTLARSLEDRNHTVSIIDSNPDAFRRLGPSFNGTKVTGIGFDQGVLERAGVEKADAFAAGAEPDFRDPSGTIRVDHVPVNEAWIGQRTVKFQAESGSRIAWIDRLGEGMIPTRESVIQEGDLLHLVMREENAERVYEVFNHGPESD